jgi:hypothetical protein
MWALVPGGGETAMHTPAQACRAEGATFWLVVALVEAVFPVSDMPQCGRFFLNGQRGVGSAAPLRRGGIFHDKNRSNG